MSPARPPRVRGLVLALVAVLILMGYAFWRSGAGGRADGAPAAGEATAPRAPVPEAARTGSGSADAAAARGADARAAASAAGGSAMTGGMDTRPSALPRPRPSVTPAPGAMNEAQLMDRLRAIKDSDPAGAAILAREGNRRFPDSADAPERTSILIHALVAADKGAEARAEAEQMVNHYPDSNWVRDVERFTGAHRHRSVGVNDAGQLIFR